MPTDPDYGYKTVAIDTEIPWPTVERIIEFQGRTVHLLPATESLPCAVRVKLEPGFPLSAGDRTILELLSAMAWAEQAAATTEHGMWSSLPINVGHGRASRRLGVTGNGHFDYLPDPPDPTAKRALALYREGLSVNSVSYQFLGFFKVINIIRDKGPDQKRWIADNLKNVTAPSALSRITAIQQLYPDVAEYLYESGRCAVAHAFHQPVVNPDDPTDLVRLASDLSLIRELARIAIESELHVHSARTFHEEHLYELEGFRALLGASLAARIKAREGISVSDVTMPGLLSLRVRDRDRLSLFEGLEATVEYVRDGYIRVGLASPCQRLVTGVTLDFANESLIFDGLDDLEIRDDGTAAGAQAMLQWAQFHRWWFGGNGTIELWNETSGTRLGRSQPYLPPVNSRFPHSEFEVMERELRERLGPTESQVRDGEE